MCVLWAVDNLTTERAQRKLERETPNGGFSGVKSEKPSPLSSAWAACSQPEALELGMRPPGFSRVALLQSLEALPCSCPAQLMTG